MAMFGIARYFYLEARGIMSEPAGMTLGSFDRIMFRDLASALVSVHSTFEVSAPAESQNESASDCSGTKATPLLPAR
jgi:hypothetical protein